MKNIGCKVWIFSPDTEIIQCLGLHIFYKDLPTRQKNIWVSGVVFNFSPYIKNLKRASTNGTPGSLHFVALNFKINIDRLSKLSWLVIYKILKLRLYETIWFEQKRGYTYEVYQDISWHVQPDLSWLMNCCVAALTFSLSLSFSLLAGSGGK